MSGRINQSVNLVWLSFVFSVFSFSFSSAGAEVVVRWKSTSGSSAATEKAWDKSGLESLKKAPQGELAGLSAEDRKKYRWALFSAFLEASLNGLPPESKASVDLISLRTAEGSERMLPRILVDRHKLLVGWSETSPGLIVRVSNRDKQRILSEGFAWPELEGESFSGVDLGNSTDKFSAVYLKQRTNPAALRGEKIFVQTCIGCHAGGENRGRHGIDGLISVLKTTDGREPAALLSNDLLAKHGRLGGAPPLGEKDKRALVSYAIEYREETKPKGP